MNLRPLLANVMRWLIALVIAVPLVVTVFVLENFFPKVFERFDPAMERWATNTNKKITAWENNTPEHLMDILRKEQ